MATITPIRDHALLSPSAASRWMRCTASAQLEAMVPDASSEFADEGTLAHAYAAKKLKALLEQPAFDEDATIKRLQRHHTGEMDECTDDYASLVFERYLARKAETDDTVLIVEKRLDVSRWIPEGFGTVDAMIVSSGYVEVIDFKYGKGVRVSATNNVQMMIYALGAVDYFADDDILAVRMTIVQPRLGNASTTQMRATDLLGWAAKELKPAAQEAYIGPGVQMVGDHCRFCRIRGKCEALADISLGTYTESLGMTMTTERMAAILPLLPTIKAWVSTMEEQALKDALSGTHFDGYKLVAGRSVRKITDPEMVMRRLREHYAPEQFMKPQELRTLTELEKLCGKKGFADLCGDLIEKPQGKPTLVPESDKRKALDSAAEDFKGIINSEL